MKELRLRFEIMRCRGDFGGKTPPNDFIQALPNSALWVSCEETTFQV